MNSKNTEGPPLLPKDLSKAVRTIELARHRGAGQEGFVAFDYSGERFYTWFQTVGIPLKTVARPLIVIHSGPGWTSKYLSNLASLHATHGVPVIFYDQLGCGHSSSPLLSDKPQDFWSLELFVAELDNILRYLGIRDAVKGFDILGHGFGGVIAVEYAVTALPSGLKHLVLSSTPASYELWKQSRSRTLDTLPADVGGILRLLEKVDHTQSEEYQRTLMGYLKTHVCRVDPWPIYLTESLEAPARDSTVSRALIGPNYFGLSGKILAWSAVGRMTSISTPVLLLNGSYDEMDNSCLQPFFDGLELVKWIKMTKSSHMPHLEEKELYALIVGDFLGLEDTSQSSLFGDTNYTIMTSDDESKV